MAKSTDGKSRVTLTYEVETNGATETKDLPFVLGVMGDYSGDNTADKKKISDKSFTKIDRYNFNTVMGGIKPKIVVTAEDISKSGGSEKPFTLNFEKLEDFEPHKIIENVDELKTLLDTRNKLRELLSKADRSEELETLLEKIVINTTPNADKRDPAKNSDNRGDK